MSIKFNYSHFGGYRLYLLTKNALPTPSFGQNPKEQQFFLVRLSLSQYGVVVPQLGEFYIAESLKKSAPLCPTHWLRVYAEYFQLVQYLCRNLFLGFPHFCPKYRNTVSYTPQEGYKSVYIKAASMSDTQSSRSGIISLIPFVLYVLRSNLIALYFYRTRVRSLAMLVTDSLTHCCLVNLIDVALACENANSKPVEVVTVAHVDAEDHVGNSLLQIWELTFGPKAKLLFRL